VLYFTGQLESANQPFEMYKRTQDDLFAAYISERAYQVASQIPTYPRSHAREAGRDYPDWIRDRYLSLPEELPDRVRSLAVQISAHAATPYDQVLAIETYLRTIPYNLDIPFPPGDQDIVDYFLFDLKQGYCDYYASAMVVLVRSIGIPARLVIGYSSGSYDPPDAVYRVSEANAHSWPEVYFPGLGWMEFEPTSALPILQDPASPPPIPENQIDSSAPLPTNANGPLAGSPLPWIAGIVGAAAVIGFALPPLMDYRLLETSSPASALLVLYQRLWTQASQGKLPVNVSDTPYEFAAILADYFRPLENSPHWLKRLIDPHDIWRFTGLVVPSMYSHHTPDRQAAFSAWRYSRRIQRALVVLNIIRRIPGRRFYPIDRDAV
jgi:hypothetical protein